MGGPSRSTAHTLRAPQGRERGPACAGCPIRCPAGIDRSPGWTGSCWPRGPSHAVPGVPALAPHQLQKGDSHTWPLPRVLGPHRGHSPDLAARSHPEVVPIHLQAFLPFRVWGPRGCSTRLGGGGQTQACALGTLSGACQRPALSPQSLCSQLLNKHPLPGRGRHSLCSVSLSMKTQHPPLSPGSAPHRDTW